MSDDQTPETPEEETDPWPKHTVEQLGAMSDLDRAKLGKDAWNKWAKANMTVYDELGGVVKKGESVDFSNFEFIQELDFKKYIFPGLSNFSSSKFKNKVDLSNSSFLGATSFQNTVFYKNAFFEEAVFKYEAFFSDSEFKEIGSFYDSRFFGSAIFCSSIFLEEINFEGAEFYGFTNFSNVIFENVSNFWAANFHKKFACENAMFNKSINWGDTNFNSEVNFSGSEFKGSVSLEGASFQQIPDFRRTYLQAHFTFHKIKINFWNHTAPKYKVFKMTEDEDAADKLRRLKELAISAKDHERELAFFSDEIRAKRFHEGGFWNTLTGYFYEWFSFFGRSIFRPFLWLVFVWSGAWTLYLKASVQGSEHFWEGAKLSTAALVPFFGASKTALESSKKVLFPSVHAGWVDLIMFSEGLLGFAFIFLIGLALRNRFRI